MPDWIRKPANPARADVLRGERHPLEGEWVEDEQHQRECGCDACQAEGERREATSDGYDGR